jgi:two-component system NtrC family sensor kinase
VDPAATALGAGEAASPLGRRVPRLRLTLRAIGVLAIVALTLYLGIVATYITHERARLFHIVKQLERQSHQHELLTETNTTLTHAVVSMQEMLNSGNVSGDHLQVDFSLVAAHLSELRASVPETEPNIARFEQKFAALPPDHPADKLVALRDSAQQLAAQVETVVDNGHRQQQMLYTEYRRLNQHITTMVTVLNLLGLAAFGAGLIWFFFRLASDIKALETRATAIVGGYRGPPLVVRRRDELGSLMLAVNRAQLQLRKWEQQEEISRQQRFHREKMAAIGSLSAAVAHEVGNPVNSISGMAQHILDAFARGTRPDDSTLVQNAELTLKQTERVATLLRQLADLGGPHSARPVAANVNELVESTCRLVRYDKRFRDIELRLDLARDVSAACVVPDHLVQVLMNLLLNAADALEGVGGRTGSIRVATRRSGAEMVLSVADDGQGMDEAVLERAFADSFTTKPAGKGRGIGLYLCKKLIEDMGGRIALESAPGAGTTARVWLPAEQTPESTSGTAARHS